MEIMLKNADFSANGISPELEALPVEKVYTNVITNFSPIGQVAVLNGFTTYFIKIPKGGITHFYFTGKIKDTFGLAIAKNVTLSDPLPSFTTISVNGSSFIITPTEGDTEYCEEREIDLTNYPDAEYFVYSYGTTEISIAHMDYLF